MASDLWSALGGAVVGAGAAGASAYVNQAAQWRRQQATRWDSVRREVYAHFLGTGHAFFLSLMDVHYCLHQDAQQLESTRRFAHQNRTDFLVIKAEVDIVGSKAARMAATDLENHLSEMNLLLAKLSSGRWHPCQVDLIAFAIMRRFGKVSWRRSIRSFPESGHPG